MIGELTAAAILASPRFGEWRGGRRVLVGKVCRYSSPILFQQVSVGHSVEVGADK